MIGNILLNVRYLLAPILIIVAGAGVLLGGIMAWLGGVLLFVGLLVDIATKFETTGVGYDENGESLGWPTFQNLTMYFMLPVFVLFQLVMAWRLYTFMALGGAEGAVISTLIDVVPLKSEIFPAGSVTLYLKTKSPSLSFEIVGTVKLCSVTSASLVPVTIGVFSSFTYNEI